MTPEAIKQFEKAFQKACCKYGATACFVLVKGEDAKGSMLMIGGSKTLSNYVECCILPNTVEAKELKQ